MEKDKDLISASNSEFDGEVIFRNVGNNPHMPINAKTGKLLIENDTENTNIVKVDIDAEVQKQFNKATPKERQRIAFRYIMDNLRGKYPTHDGRIVAIERVGAKEMTHTLYEPKIRVIPELGQFIKAGEFLKISKAEHGPFKEFAYYKVNIKMANDTYSAVLNVGIRNNGDSTLYDINQFNKT